ncbi:MAG: 1,4-dihydroxy-2-naphthoate octaprenyltransferase [Firmicutes bacterium]|nr:1,4-dihydroxy-2-naphthoate octaprenyltransferase [Bacillota bacterium]
MTFQQFMRVARPPTLTATVVPLFAGGAIAWTTGHFVWWCWLDIMAIAFIMQIAANMLNEYFDWNRGEDNAESLGIGGIIVSGEVTPQAVLRGALLLYAIALILGLVLVWFRGYILLIIGILAILGGFLYTGGPYPISATPFGELMVLTIMGPLEVLGTTYAAAGEMTATAWIVSWPVGISVATILLANNLRDHVKDAQHGRRTIPIILGVNGGFKVLKLMVLIILLWITGAVILKALPLAMLVIWAALPLAILTVRQLQAPHALRRAVPIVGRLHLIFGALITVGILWSRIGH